MDPLEYLVIRSAGPKNPMVPTVEPTALISNSNYVAYGETTDVPLSTIVNAMKKSVKFKLAVFTSMAYSVGIGYYTTADTSTPTGRRAKQIVDDFCEDYDLDTKNQIMARDVWESGNHFINAVGTPTRPLQGIFSLPLSSFYRIQRDVGGNVLQFIQRWGGYGEKNLSPTEVLHARWLPIDEGAFGEGLGQIMARPGMGYYGNSGNLITREPWFQAEERVQDVTSKMVYSGLPRYFGYFEGPGSESDDFVQSANNQFNKLDPLQHFMTNVKGTVQTIALDTSTRFDSFIRHIDDDIITGSMSPLIRLWSSVDYTYASSRQAVEAMHPMVSMYQRFHKRFVERLIFTPLLLQDNINPKKAQVRLNWGNEEVDVNALLSAWTILQDQRFDGLWNPQDMIDQLKEIGIKLSEVETENTENSLNVLRDMAKRAAKGRTVDLSKLTPQQKKALPPPAVFQRFLKE